MKRIAHFLIAALAALSFGAQAQEATIRKNLAERLPSLPRLTRCAGAHQGPV